MWATFGADRARRTPIVRIAWWAILVLLLPVAYPLSGPVGSEWERATAGVETLFGGEGWQRDRLPECRWRAPPLLPSASESPGSGRPVLHRMASARAGHVLPNGVSAPLLC